MPSRIWTGFSFDINMNSCSTMSDRQWYCSDSVGKFCRVWFVFYIQCYFVNRCYTLNGWGFKCGNISSNSIRDSSCIVELNDNVSIRTNIFNISLLDDHSEFDVLVWSFLYHFNFLGSCYFWRILYCSRQYFSVWIFAIQCWFLYWSYFRP